ncbi:unnamed protein product [Phytophthora lilii]|uniref:Unnamed protein product n=1 Tax=Phytophthora lilii TaxID=2077276 RepID=A0A9W6XVI3_9STRA|nr:unnamed protein product [Phytophthora lilii]
MHLGYHAVKCRSQRELTKGTSIEKGVANELAFFNQHEYWRRLPPHLWGVPKLSERLVSILQDNIRRSLPKVVAEISSLMAETQKSLASLGAPLESPGAQRQQFGKWANEYLRLMEAAMRGQYELLPAVGGLAGDKRTWGGRLRAVLKQEEAVFQAEVEAISDVLGFFNVSRATTSHQSTQDGNKIAGKKTVAGDSVAVQLENERTMVCDVKETRGTDVLCDSYPQEWFGASRWSFESNVNSESKSMSLKQFIQANRGDELSIFPSYRVFCSCVHRCVREWNRPAMQLLDHYNSQTRAISLCLISKIFAGNSRVERFFKETSDRVLETMKESAQQQLQLLLQHESRPYTQDQRLYDELDKLRQRAIRARLDAALPSTDHGLVSLADVTQVLGGISMGPFAMSSSDREALEMEIALRAYLKVASHRFVDVVPMKLNGLLLESFLREMENELLGIATDEIVAELLQENDDKAAHRQQLQEQLCKLEQGKRAIEKSAYW